MSSRHLYGVNNTCIQCHRASSRHLVADGWASWAGSGFTPMMRSLSPDDKMIASIRCIPDRLEHLRLIMNDTLISVVTGEWWVNANLTHEYISSNVPPRFCRFTKTTRCTTARCTNAGNCLIGIDFLNTFSLHSLSKLQAIWCMACQQMRVERHPGSLHAVSTDVVDMACAVCAFRHEPMIVLLCCTSVYVFSTDQSMPRRWPYLRNPHKSASGGAASHIPYRIQYTLPRREVLTWALLLSQGRSSWAILARSFEAHGIQREPTRNSIPGDRSLEVQAIFPFSRGY
nr:hypothetical protein CFP56_67002 [Quercus suber]